MREFSVGQDGLLSWSPPVPPNEVILHYNVIISTATSGEVVSVIEEWDQLTINVSNYGEINMDYNVTVYTKSLLVYSGTSDNGHPEKWTTSLQYSSTAYSYVVYLRGRDFKQWTLNNGLNTRPQCVPYLDVPLYTTKGIFFEKYCHIHPTGKSCHIN